MYDARFDETNDIDKTAKIADGVVLGKWNKIGPGVQIGSFDGSPVADIFIGDCNTFNEGVRILGVELINIGDWCTFHRNVSIIGDGPCEIGHNFWIGQDGLLDTRGGLFIRNGVRIGCDAHVWTHVAAGELIEGCELYDFKPVTIDHDAWLIGDNISVNPGVVIGHHSAVQGHSRVSHDTVPWELHRGVPAKSTGKRIYHNVSPSEKFAMMLGWMQEWLNTLKESTGNMKIFQPGNADTAAATLKYPWLPSRIVVAVDCTKCGIAIDQENDTVFDIATKTFTKHNTWLERAFYAFICGTRARFTPVSP